MFEQLINAIGSMAEMSALFYTTLITKGVPDEAATEMSCTFVQTLLETASPNRENS